LTARRSHLFEDAYATISGMSDEDLNKRLVVSFRDEEGVDAGGLSREFFLLASHRIADRQLALFEPASNGELQIDPNSSVHSEDTVDMFTFVGRIVGLALANDKLLDVVFAPAIYKMLLGDKPGLEDLAEVEPELYRSFSYMLNNPAGDLLDDFTFSVTQAHFDSHETVDLIPNGRNISVTEANKAEYVDLRTQWAVVEKVAIQAAALVQGFNEVVPHALVEGLDWRDLKILLTGTPVISPIRWRIHTEYTGYTSTSDTIRHFWQTVQSWDHANRAKLLCFVTGTSRLPAGGFDALAGVGETEKFHIAKGQGNGLPTSHTCHNVLILPPYPTAKMLKEKLEYAINETAGFGEA
ncbi:hypothetical protein BDK51DRAFT_16587, partial [Blyttiomyces helicus]